jgi:D-sedoheptulose 7-phosphate isomerase
MSYTTQYLQEVRTIIEQIDAETIEKMVSMLATLRERGVRLFLLGIGGSAANASHAVNDFRKLTGIEAYAPTDNVSELSARANDEDWETIFSAWLTTVSSTSRCPGYWYRGPRQRLYCPDG